MTLEINRIKNIFNELHNLYGEDVSDKEYDEDYKEFSKDINFLQVLCLGPWKGKRRDDVENKMRKHREKEKIIGLTDINEKNYEGLYPFKWQQERARSLAKFLRDEDKTFDAFLTELENTCSDDSMKIIDALGKATNGGKTLNNHKIISAFVRDVMKKDAFPLDSRVKEMLGFLGLPSDEELIIKLCRKNELNPRILNRMMWLHNGGDEEKYHGYCNKGCKNNENQCPIKSECYKWMLREG